VRYLAAIILMTVATAEAQPVKINVIGVVSKLESTGQAGPISMPLQLQRKVARVGIKRVQAKGINISEGTFRPVADPFPENRFGTDLAVIFREFSAGFNRARDLKLIKPKTVTHIIAPPFVVYGSRYIGGAAFVCSAPRGGYSYSNAVEFNSRGASRVVHSIHGFMHEILHAVGAYHSDAAGNVMHPDALSQIEAQITQGGKRQLTILNESRAQVFKCIGR
jgi:hypothetical protein